MHEVGEDGLGAELAEHGGDLAAVIGAVIDDVLERLPERIGVDAEVHCFVFDDAVDVCLREGADEIEEIGGDGIPFRFERGEVGELCGVGEGGWGFAFEALEPDGFGAIHVGERVADGGEAVAERLGELFGREGGGGLEGAFVGPVVVGEEKLEFVGSHCVAFQL